MVLQVNGHTRIILHHSDQPRMNGWTSASLGLILFAGSRDKHLSSKSTNVTIILFSSSFSFTEAGGISVTRKSRVGFAM